MSARGATGARDCSRLDAVNRLAQAKKFLEVAEMCLDDGDESTPMVAAALSVLAGIAASDAACCAKLKERSRGKNHHDAEKLLATIHPDGHEMKLNLQRLINEKDNAHYGTMMVSNGKATKMVGWARKLIDLADQALTD